MTLDEDTAPPAEFAPMPALRPVTDPIDLRDRTIADYTRNMGRPGMPSTPEGIERLAVSDLGLSDAFRRDEPSGMAPTAAQRAAAKADRDAALVAAQREKGVELTRDAPRRDPGPQFDLPVEYGTSERWQLAKGRLALILFGASPPKRFPSGAFDFASMTSTCTCPDLAHRYLAHWFDFDLRYVPETQKHNPYFGMNHRDASLKLARLVEDLADASTGRLGTWLVPK